MRRVLAVAFALLCSSTLSGRPADASSPDTTHVGEGRARVASAAVDAWTPTTTTGAPLSRYAHTAVWTGTKMIVWGGKGDSDLLNDGGQYDPVADTWTALTTVGAPAWRSDHTAVWTGSRMIVWGGIVGDSSSVNDGGQYDPVANAWTPTATAGAPSGRTGHAYVWTGSKMIVWGGYDGTDSLNGGGLYDPVANAWTLTETTGAPSARSSATAVWTGSKMIVWGGYDMAGVPLNDGGQYDPVANAWTAMTTSGAPSGRSDHIAVWTGSRMVVWGGFGTGSDLGDGGQYDPAGNSWSSTSMNGAPGARSLHRAVWSGTGVIVWGGISINSPLGDGGRYDPATNTWSVVTSVNAPPGRWGHTSVWTGTRMIVWGGYGDGVTLNDGGQWAEGDSAPPPPPTCDTLTAGASPAGSGTVTVNTAQNCAGGFTAGTIVSLRATPQAGRAFAGWSGSGGAFSSTTANPTTFTVAGNATVTAFFAASGGGLSVFVSGSPSPALVNQTVTFSCLATGGSPPYTYQWRSPATSTFVAGTSQTFSSSLPVPGVIQAGCTVRDNVGASSGNAATVTIEAPPPPPACVDADFTVLDRDNGLAPIPLSSGIAGPYFGVTTGQNLAFQATATGLVSASWTFGNGASGSGNPASYTYGSAGTFTATVTVNANSACAASHVVVVSPPPPEPTKWFAAGLAYVQGALPGTIWQSDLTIFNPHPTLAGTYSLAFLDGANPVPPANLEWKTFTIDAQKSGSASNVLATIFGKAPGSYGAVIVRGDVAPAAPTITSRTYNAGDPVKGTFGLSVPVTQATGGVSPQSSAAQRVLIGLRDDDAAYTNVILVNLVSTGWSHAHLTFLDETGEPLGQPLGVDVPPYGVAQLTKPLTSEGWLGLPPRSLFQVQVAVDAGGAVFPYATVIDQKSTDPIVVTPTEQPVNTYRIPGIVRLAGANDTVWRSRFVLHNPSTSARKVEILYSFVPCDTTGLCGGRQVSSGPGDVSMAAGETRAWDDFPAAWLTAVPGGSVSDSVKYQDAFVDVAPAAGDANEDPLLVLGETYNSQPGGPVGLQVSGFTDLDGGSPTGAARQLLLTGLVSNAGFRTNVAFFLTSASGFAASEASASFNVRVLSDSGVTLKSFGVSLSDSSPFRQVNDPDLFADVEKTGWMSIIVDSFDGSPVAAYATIIDNTSGDATFVKAQPAP